MEDQIVFRELSSGGEWSLEFGYNSEFIDYLKQRVPASGRSYDPETHIWKVFAGPYPSALINALTGVAVQKFRHASLIYRNDDDKLTTRNLKTGQESVQESLF